MRGTEGDEGGDVEGAHTDDLDIRPARGEAKRAAAFVAECRLGFDPRARQQRQRLFEDAALGNGDDDRRGHSGAGFTGGGGEGQW
jgi:hypothetical protein